VGNILGNIPPLSSVGSRVWSRHFKTIADQRATDQAIRQTLCHRARTGHTRRAWMGFLGGEAAHSAIRNPALAVEARSTHKGLSAAYGRSRWNVEGPIQPDTGRLVAAHQWARSTGPPRPTSSTSASPGSHDRRRSFLLDAGRARVGGRPPARARPPRHRHPRGSATTTVRSSPLPPKLDASPATPTTPHSVSRD
jgi:hypothetical protein